jgi:addiction module HigA family antidote
MKKLPNIFPGEILKDEFLEPLHISAYQLAKSIDVPVNRITAIINGKRSITADTALRLSKFFGNSVEFWLGLQNMYDIEEGRIKIAGELKKIRGFEKV